MPPLPPPAGLVTNSASTSTRNVSSVSSFRFLLHISVRNQPFCFNGAIIGKYLRIREDEGYRSAAGTTSKERRTFLNILLFVGLFSVTLPYIPPSPLEAIPLPHNLRCSLHAPLLCSIPHRAHSKPSLWLILPLVYCMPFPLGLAL